MFAIKQSMFEINQSMFEIKQSMFEINQSMFDFEKKKSQIPSKTQHYERRQLVLWNGEGFLGNTEHLVRIWGDTHTHKTLYRIDNLFKGFTTKVWEVFASFFSLLDKKTEKFYTTITVWEKKDEKKITVKHIIKVFFSLKLYVEHVAYLKKK